MENIRSQPVQPSRLCWFGFMLPVTNTCLSYRVLFFVPIPEWKEPSEDQRITWQHRIIKRTANLYKIRVPCIHVWSPKGSSNNGLETLKNTTRNHEQWRLCYHFPFNENDWKDVRFTVRSFCMLATTEFSCPSTPCPLCVFILSITTCDLKKVLVNEDCLAV